MPYENADDPNLPSNVKKLSKKKRKKWVAVWNDVFSKCQADDGGDCEAAAFKAANGTISTNRLLVNLHFAINQIGQVRRETHGGVDYLIAPVTAIIEGVLNERFVPAAVIEASTYSWQGTPVPLGHPQENGAYISANTPELTANSPARFWNPYFENGALKGEIWIDVQRARSLGGDAWETVQRIEQGELIECSTGYYADEIGQLGIYGGKRYQSVVTAIYPDHLAVLLNETGACSVVDGCGVLANQEDVMPKENDCDCKIVTVNLEFSLSDQEQLVYEAWYKLKYPEYGMHTPVEQMLEGRIIKVYSDRVDVSRLDGLWAYPYTIGEDGAISFGDPQQYQLTANQAGFMQSIIGLVHQVFRSSKEASVKDKLIQNLLANKRNKFTKEQLEAFDEKTLQALSEMTETAAETPAPAPSSTPAPSPTPATSETPSNEAPAWAKALTDKIEAQGKQIEQLAGQLTANAAKERQPVIDFITANSDLFKAEELQAKPMDELERIKQLVAAANHYPVNYAGLGMPAVNAAGDQIAQPPSLIKTIQERAN